MRWPSLLADHAAWELLVPQSAGEVVITHVEMHAYLCFWPGLPAAVEEEGGEKEKKANLKVKVSVKVMEAENELEMEVGGEVSQEAMVVSLDIL